MSHTKELLKRALNEIVKLRQENLLLERKAKSLEMQLLHERVKVIDLQANMERKITKTFENVSAVERSKGYSEVTR